MSTDKSEKIRLKELGTSKFEVSKNEADIRGWTVKNDQGRILGKVHDLLFDKESEKVLYIVLDLEGNEMHLRDRKVLAPLDIAQINEAYKNVFFPGVMANELTELPTYEKGKVSTRVEDIVLHAFANTSNQASNRISDEQVSTGGTYQSHRVENSAPMTDQADRARPQTVVGVFEHTNQAQAAIDHLLNHNFKRNQIEISGRNTNDGQQSAEEDNGSMTNWFKSVFGNDKDARTYADAAKTGSVVTVQTSSYQDAEQVADVLDKHGAVSVSDSQSGQNSNYRSRILDRRDANSKW